ncbi:MAG: alpha/beta fold hydrolase [Chitinophagaceae bacterium]|nr:alpha/beta fold hydrolase [Chitinophagaceae bacterium]
MKRGKWWLYAILILIIVYLMGPRPADPVYDKKLPEVPSAANLDTYINQHESQHKLRPDNEARIVWADSSKSITDYSILYLHGFSASQGEGDPVHKDIAKKYHCNLYLSRLAEHGIDTTEKLQNLTADKLWESAKEAYAIASKIGRKVIVVGTSTGASLALMLAANYPQVHSLVLLSPNIEIFDSNAWILNNPWGLQLAKLINGSPYIISQDTRPIYKQYWSYGYRIESVVQLEEMLESAMKPGLFKKVTQPALMLYYYRDEIHQDSVVKVDAMQKMFSELGTPADKKRAVPIPNAGNHVIGSYIKSNDVAAVEKEIEKFIDEVLRIK